MRKWCGWCSRRQIDPIRSPIKFAIEFLSDQFDEGHEYNSIAGYRSALSVFHESVDGVGVGKHPFDGRSI